MSMKFWQKTYLVTLTLFLVFLNVGLFTIGYFTYQNNIKTAENNCRAEYDSILSSLVSDHASLSKINERQGMEKLAKSYGEHYKKQNVHLSILRYDVVLFEGFSNPLSYSAETVTRKTIESKDHVIISHQFEDKYTMVYAKSIDYVHNDFHALTFIFALFSLLTAILLAVVLFFILKKMFSPLSKLQETTNAIANGDLSLKADESGKDEFAALGKSFNAMVGKLKDHMQSLAEEADDKQLLVDNLAHELRTPLTTIHGYAEFIEKAPTDEDTKIEIAKFILSESERLQKISEKILDEAYIRNNGIHAEEIDLSEVLLDSAKRLKLRAIEKEVVILTDLQPSVINADKTLLSLLFYNLIENAIKACEPGDKVTLSCRDGIVHITDTGKGMEKEQLAHIVKPFYRTDKSRSRAEGGAGLGLALCHRIVLAHNAKMEFDSVLGKGTDVIVSFSQSTEG